MSDEEMLRRAIAMSRALTRRRFLRSSAAAAGALVAGPAFLAACGDDDGDDTGDDGSSGRTDQATSKGSGTESSHDVYHANWTEYLDDETPGLFEAATGLKLFYSEEYNDNNEYFAKIQPDLSAGNPIAPDIITPTFWLAGRLITLGWVEPIPFDKIPNSANLVDALKNPTWDPSGEYSLPWQSGMAGLAYNQAETGREIRSIDDLFDPAFKGKIGINTEMRDSVGLIALGMGIDIEKPEFDAFAPVFERLEAAVADGQVRRFHGNDYTADLQNGDLAICIGWSGDVTQLARDNPDVKFAIPESGGTLWSDTMVIPKGADKLDNAAKWMDFVYDPVNAALITAFVGFISPVKGVQEELRKMGGEAALAADSPLIFPDDETLALLKSWGNLDEDAEAQFEERFAQVQGN